MLRLSRVTKRYPGSANPAVDGLDLNVAAGELLVFVGPSGCGKSTTLRMINRLIEPTSGTIEVDGTDVMRQKATILRRRIGYVIQQTGLLPHITVADNVATVPKLLGWSRDRIRARVGELLDLVGLDPATYGRRYPRELSGGQQQRVGVARALAADPPVLLMDEPFGATDPITREHLQSELLRIQAEVRKTIVLVTHDIDEAITLGDRVAVFDPAGRFAQVGSPDDILANPASSYVRSFIGAGASLKRLHLLRLGELNVEAHPTVRSDDSLATVRSAVAESETGSVLVLDAQDRPRTWLSADDLVEVGPDLAAAGTVNVAVMTGRASLHDVLDAMLGVSGAGVVVVDDDGRYQGIVGLDSVLAHVERLHSQARDQDLAAADRLRRADRPASL